MIVRLATLLERWPLMDSRMERSMYILQFRTETLQNPKSRRGIVDSCMDH